MSKTYNVYLLGTKKETRDQKTNKVITESLTEIIARRKNATRNARLVQMFK